MSHWPAKSMVAAACAALCVAALSIAPQEVRAGGGATPDVPFVDDLVALEPVVETNLSHLHLWLAHQPCRYFVFDESYDSLAAQVNGFLHSVAGDISRNNFHEDAWKAQAASITQEINNYNDLLTKTQAAIEQNNLPPPALNCPYGNLQAGHTASAASAAVPSKPPAGAPIQFSFSTGDLDKWFQDSQNMRVQGQIQDDAQRAAFANQLLQEQWPEECDLSLVGDKLPCVKSSMPAPTPMAPHPVSSG